MVGGQVTVIIGENSFEALSKVSRLKKEAEKSGFIIEVLSADNLTQEDLINITRGVSLFAEKRLIIIKNLSENINVWEDILDIISNISSDVHLCLVESKIDKRGSIFKQIKKIAIIHEANLLTSKDSKNLAELARKIGKNIDLNLDMETANFLVSWVGVNEWSIYNAIQRLKITQELAQKGEDENLSLREQIEKFIPKSSESNALDVFSLVLRGKFEGVIQEISNLRISEGDEGAYLFFGLISSQFFNLLSLKIGKKSGKNVTEIAKDIGINAWVLSKMEVFEQNLSYEQVKTMALKFAETDEKIKSSGVNAWDLIESLLLEISIISKT